MHRAGLALVGLAFGVALLTGSLLSVTATATTDGTLHQASALADPTVATLTASTTGQETAGSEVSLNVQISNYVLNGTLCGNVELVWLMTNIGTGTYSVVGADDLPASPAGWDGVYNTSWTAATGSWNFTADLNPSGACAPAVSNSVQLNILNPSTGALTFPAFIWQMLTDTYNAVVTALDQGIATPIAAVLTTIGSGVASLEAPWGQALESWGILGPLAVVLGFGLTAICCYLILFVVGSARLMLGT